MSKYSIVQAFEAPKYTDLITALFWVASRVYIKPEDNGYELSGKTLIRWWVELLDIDTSEYKKHSKYLTNEICGNPRPPKKDKTGYDKAIRLNKQIQENALTKLNGLLQVLLKKKISLYGVKYTKGKQITFIPARINSRYIVVENIDVEQETLSCGQNVYHNLSVLTDRLIDVFEPKQKTLSTKTISNVAQTAIIESEKITKRKLGGRPIKDIYALLREYVISKGGFRWFKIKHYTRMCDCKDYLKEKGFVVDSDGTIDLHLKQIRKELEVAEN